ncbi:MAG: HD domain-containing protein [Oscillospiraceae bacterium]|nr:HD domain-containing protein [Oscillospiraceae bacterium]
MANIVNSVRAFVLEKCEQHKKNPKFGHYDYWNDHIKRVVFHAVNLAVLYGADAEIVELGALLHDISMPSELSEQSKQMYKAKYETLMSAVFVD